MGPRVEKIDKPGNSASLEGPVGPKSYPVDHSKVISVFEKKI
jgi:hypothetical protein